MKDKPKPWPVVDNSACKILAERGCLFEWKNGKYEPINSWNGPVIVRQMLTSSENKEFTVHELLLLPFWFLGLYFRAMVQAFWPRTNRE